MSERGVKAGLAGRKNVFHGSFYQRPGRVAYALHMKQITTDCFFMEWNRKFPAAALCGLFFCGMLDGREYCYPMEKDSDFRATFKRDFDKVCYVPNGVTGRCFKAVVPADSGKGFTVHSGNRQYTRFPVELHVSGMFKGKGTFTIGFIVYNRQGKIYWITKAPGSSSPPFSIHSDRWEKKYFLFRPSEENVQEITGFLTMVSLSPGSEIYMDDIRTRIMERPAAAGRDGSGR